MNLPHLPPVLFAKKVLQKDGEKASVLCEFPYLPTLPMLLEAAAQASSCFGDLNEGFLVGASDVKKIACIDSTKMVICIRKEIDSQNMHIFSFLIDNVAEGRFTIYAQ